MMGRILYVLFSFLHFDDAAFWNSMDFSFACTYIYTCTCIYTSNLTMCNEVPCMNIET